jgi:hypothetical protein
MILETTWMTPSGWVVVHDGLTIGPWHDDHADETSHTRPPTDHDADHMLVRHIECIRGRCRSRRCASRCSTTAALPRNGRGSRRTGRPRRRPTENAPAADLRSADRDRGQPCPDTPHADRGRGAIRRARLAARPPWPRALRERQAPPPDHLPLLARLARRRAVPRPSLASAPPALGAHAQGRSPDHVRPRRRARHARAGACAREGL